MIAFVNELPNADALRSLLQRKAGRPDDLAAWLRNLIRRLSELRKAGKQPHEITQGSENLSKVNVSAILNYGDVSGLRKRFKNAKSLLDPQPHDWREFVRLCWQGEFDSWIGTSSNQSHQIT